MSAVLTVASLVLEARKDASLHEALVQHHDQVAQRKRLPAKVTESAAFALRNVPTTKNGIWF